MAEEKKLIQVPKLKKKNRSLQDLRPDSLAAALHWDKLAGQLADKVPADPPPAPVEASPTDPPPAG